MKEKKILIYRWKAYNYTDVYQAFQILGYSVEIIEQELKSYDTDFAFEEKLVRILDTKEYALVFTMNYFAVIAIACEKCKVPYVFWTCDNPLISMYHKSVFAKTNFGFTFDRTNQKELQEMGMEHIYYLPLSVDCDRIDYLRRQRKMDRAAYRNEISFVGSLYERNSYDRLEPILPEYLRGYFDACMEAQINISGGNIIEKMLTVDILQELQQYFQLEKSEDSFSDLGLVFSTTVLGFKVAALQRSRGLLALAKHYPVSIYSNSNTEHLLGVQYRGSLDYHTEMPLVFAESKINLNFTIPNIKTGLPLRIWDVLGAEGFLLTNFQAEIPEHFKIGEDLVCFEDERELVELAGYYLQHEEKRKEIARHGYETVKGRHSYVKRVEEMLAIVDSHSMPV